MTSCAAAPDGRTFVAGDAAGRVHFVRLMEPTSPEGESETATEPVFRSYCRDDDAAGRELYDELTAAGRSMRGD